MEALVLQPIEYLLILRTVRRVAFPVQDLKRGGQSLTHFPSPSCDWSHRCPSKSISGSDVFSVSAKLNGVSAIKNNCQWTDVTYVSRFLKEQIGLNRFSPGFYVSMDPEVVPVRVRLEQNGEKNRTSCWFRSRSDSLEVVKTQERWNKWMLQMSGVGLVPSGRVICADVGSGSWRSDPEEWMFSLMFVTIKSYLIMLLWRWRGLHMLSCKPMPK